MILAAVRAASTLLSEEKETYMGRSSLDQEFDAKANSQERLIRRRREERGICCQRELVKTRRK
jgi:hypothetical protein